jgi:bacillithiol system protein YtxJ
MSWFWSKSKDEAAQPEGWNVLESVAQLDAVFLASNSRPQLIFKHSTRCPVSSHAWAHLKESTSQLKDRFDLHFLDLIQFREVSNQIEQRTGVQHQSPQVICVKGGEAIYNSSHHHIDAEAILVVG